MALLECICVKTYVTMVIKFFGLDNMNDYYSVDLKRNRLKELKKYKNFVLLVLIYQIIQKVNSIFENLMLIRL